ncbi:MAG TPA: hypothetical protein VLT33_49900 [Labilithrix sp.]|nr:hypothetical protein [Labilithrix sp.]
MRAEIVHEVLRRWQSGAGLRAIARATHLDRKTVRRYVGVALAMRLDRSSFIDDEVIGAVLRVVGRQPSRVTEVQQSLEAQRERIRLSLALRVSLTRIHATLVSEGADVSYATLRRFAIDELGWRVRASRGRLPVAA